MSLDENDYRIAQAEAWEAVCNTLSKVAPHWSVQTGTGIECATNTIRKLAAKANAYDMMVKFLVTK